MGQALIILYVNPEGPGEELLAIWVILWRNCSSDGGFWKTSVKKSTASCFGDWEMDWKNNSLISRGMTENSVISRKYWWSLQRRLACSIEGIDDGGVWMEAGRLALYHSWNDVLSMLWMMDGDVSTELSGKVSEDRENNWFFGLFFKCPMMELMASRSCPSRCRCSRCLRSCRKCSAASTRRMWLRVFRICCISEVIIFR